MTSKLTKRYPLPYVYSSNPRKRDRKFFLHLTLTSFVGLAYLKILNSFIAHKIILSVTKIFVNFQFYYSSV